jgi:glycosyltransferase involved in cell wall biosynthesis
MAQFSEYRSRTDDTDYRPRVSYVMATKNHGEQLKKALENVREFIQPADELIIVDGGSTDGTAAVIEENRDIITIFDSEPDFGEAHALNKAIYLSRGRYIKPLDDADYLYPDVMHKLIDVFDEHPDVDAIQCGGEAWDMRGPQPVFDGLRYLPAQTEPTPIAIFANTLCSLGLIVRRTAMERIGGVSSNYRAVDADLTCRLIECDCVLRYLDLKLFRWNIHPHSGINEGGNYSHDFALINLRLGNWKDFMRHEPEFFLSLTKGATDAEDRALAHWIWIAALLARSPLRYAYVPIYWVASQLLKLRRLIKGPPPGSMHDDKHQWTGKLR